MHPIDGVAGEVGQHEVVQVLQHADVEPRQLEGKIHSHMTSTEKGRGSFKWGREMKSRQGTRLNKIILVVDVICI